MRQLSLRIDDDTAERLKAVAAETGRSVNAYVGAVLRAAVDPDLATGEAARLRARLLQAGLLAPSIAGAAPRPDAASVERARKRAGRGRPLSELVGEGRG